VTVTPLLGGNPVICHTRDVSDVGACLDITGIAEWLPVGTRVAITLADPSTGNAIEVIGDIARETTGPNPALGVLLVDPSPEWKVLVAHAASQVGTSGAPKRRMRVLVYGSEQRQRGAMALYVSSGWDVLFADDDFGLHEVLKDIRVDAVIIEMDADDPFLETIIYDIERAQPNARRIVRGRGRRGDTAVHRFVDRDAGLEALLDAVTARLEAQPSA